MFCTTQGSGMSASVSAAILSGLLFSATSGLCQEAGSAKLSLSRSYPIEQVTIRSGTGLVEADRVRAVAIGRHQGQTATQEWYGDADEEEPECAEDEEFVSTQPQGVTALRNAVSFAATSASGSTPVDVDL